jgi:hypothetical protein
MRRNIPTIFVILSLISLILCSACVLSPSGNQNPQQNTQQNVGLVQISEISPYISFDVANQNLIEYRPDPANESTGLKKVYYIHGTNVDGSGNATSWIFGVQHSGGSELLAYDLSGWTQIPWNVSQLSEEIDVDRIVSPGSLFRQNQIVIFGNSSSINPDRRDLDLIRGIYTLTISSGNQNRILKFNATTGRLIQ